MEAAIPRWVQDIAGRKPYTEIVDGTAVPHKRAGVSPADLHGRIAVRVGAQLLAWAAPEDSVGVEIQHTLHEAGRWSALLPDVSYSSAAFCANDPDPEYPRRAPELAIEVRSPSRHPDTEARKIELYLQHGARMVVVIDPKSLRVHVHEPSRTYDVPMSGTWQVPHFAGLVIDWDAVLRGLKLPPSE